MILKGLFFNLFIPMENIQNNICCWNSAMDFTIESQPLFTFILTKPRSDFGI